MNPTQAIAHLIDAGLSEKDIGAAVDVSQVSVNRYRRGLREPDWPLGVKLIDLANRVIANPGLVDEMRRASV